MTGTSSGPLRYALAATCVVLAGANYLSGLGRAHACVAPAHPEDRHRSGFALSELLVAISVVVLLVSLALPALDNARQKRYDMASLNNLRQHAIVMGMYTDDYKDFFPLYVEPRVGSFAVVRRHDEKYLIGYLSQTTEWNSLMCEQYYDGEFLHQSFFAPDDERYADLQKLDENKKDWLWDSSYVYSTTCLTHPDYWRMKTRTGPDQWQVQMRSRVRFPSDKGLFLQMWPLTMYINRDWWHRAAFMDGHAEQRLIREFFPAEIGDVEFMSAPSPWPVLHTKDGILGRDLRD